MTIKTPAGLHAEGKQLWTGVTDENELRPDELRVLEDACREADIIALMENERGKASFKLIVKGSMGQDVINPLISELRQHRATLAGLLRQLKLSDGESGEAISNNARRAAQARWARRTG